MSNVAGEIVFRVTADASSVRTDIEKAIDQAKVGGLKKELEGALQYQDRLAALIAQGGGSSVLAQYQERLEAVQPEIAGLKAQIAELAAVEQAEVAAAEAAVAAKERQALATGKVTAATDKAKKSTAGFDDLLRRVGGSSGTSGNALGVLAGKAGLIGLAASAAFQGIRELQEGLRVTGEEAFTTEGKIRNFGAELIGGNIIGGFKALIAESSRLDWEKFITGAERSTAELTLFATEAYVASEATKQEADAITYSAREHDRFASILKFTQQNLKDEAAQLYASADAASFYAAAAKRAADIDAYWASVKFNRERDQTPRFETGPTIKREAALIEAQARGDLAAVKKLQEAELAKDLREKETTTSLKRRDELVTEIARDKADIIGTENQIQSEIDRKNREAEAEADRRQREDERKAKERDDARKKAKAKALADYKEADQLDLQRIKNRQAAAALDEKVTKADLDAKRAEIAKYAAIAKDRKHYTALERAAAQESKLTAQKELKELQSPKSEGGLTAEGLFRLSVDNFQKFGSNVTSGFDGILSPQDARGQLAGALLGKSGRSATNTSTAAGRVSRDNVVAAAIQTNAQAESQRASKVLIELRIQTGLLRKIAGGTRNLSVGINGGREVNAQGTEWVGPRRF